MVRLLEVGMRAGAILSTSGLAVMAAIDPIAAGEQVGAASPAGILGIVAVVCVLGIIGLHYKSEKHTERLYTLIEENIRSQQRAADVMGDVRDTLRECHQRSVPQ